jgi:thiol:disulfide interchange protein DsbG
MDRRLLATSLLLLPSLASATSQCMVQASDLGQGIQSSEQPPAVAQPSRPQPLHATVPLPGMRTVSVDEISRVPALRRIASAGAQLTDLGTEHGLRTVFARNGQSFQVFYLTPDG